MPWRPGLAYRMNGKWGFKQGVMLLHSCCQASHPDCRAKGARLPQGVQQPKAARQSASSERVTQAHVAGTAAHMAVHLEETKPLAALTAVVHTPSVNQVQKPQVKATRPVCSAKHPAFRLRQNSTAGTWRAYCTAAEAQAGVA
jgi:hypothetical protein